MNRLLTIFLFLLLSYGNSFGRNINAHRPISVDSITKHKKIKLKFDSGVEYFIPTDISRSIQTCSANLLFGVEFSKKTPLSIYGGITATYAWGNIIQWDDNFKDIPYSNRAFGLGPAFLIRFEPFLYNGLSFSPDLGGALILYSNKFPHGGDIYNFMWRFGGAVHYRMDNNYAINLTAKWMHVSNGQGLGPQNPSYEGWGIGVSFVKYFK